MNRTLYLGGARSGKSSLAESSLQDFNVTYVAPGKTYPTDPEWQDRVQVHQRRRPDHWNTIETADLVGVIAEATPESPVLIDCLTLWLTAALDDLHAWDIDEATAMLVAQPRIDALRNSIQTCRGGVVLVSNEVGSGVVPSTSSGRMFRDLLGICNASVASACDEVYLVVAGLPMTLKGSRR